MVVIIQAMIQCVELPSDPPCERTALGKISEMKTQMTAPWEKAKKAIKPIRYSSKWLLPERSPEKAQAVRLRKTIIPNEPMIKSFFRPNLSMMVMASKVQMRLATPI